MRHAETTAAARPYDRRRLVLLGAIAALGSLAIQIIVPALPATTAGLGASPRDGQLIISVYQIGLAFGQLGSAPLADRFGRRPMLLGGTVAFLIGCICCGLAGSMTVMLGGRLLQAAGAAAALVAARSMVTDAATKEDTAAQLAILGSVILISPALAPVVGGLVAGIAGWRALFWVMAAITVLGFVIAVRLLAETRRGDGQPLHAARIAGTYARVARHPRYMRLSLANGMISGGIYVFLVVSPFMLAQAGATSAQSGLFYACVATATVLGSLSVPAVSRRYPAALVPVGSAILAVGAVAVTLVASLHVGVLGLLGAMALISFGAGMVLPTLQAEGIEGQRERASTATSLMSTIQIASAAAISTMVVRLSPSSTISLAIIGGLIAGALVLRGRLR